MVYKVYQTQCRLYVLRKYDSKCAYCGRDITLRTLNIDHYYPKKLSNAYKALYDFDVNIINNLLPSCFSCNNRKRAKEPSKWKSLFLKTYPHLLDFYFNTLPTLAERMMIEDPEFIHPCASDYIIPNLPG